MLFPGYLRFPGFACTTGTLHSNFQYYPAALISKDLSHGDPNVLTLHRLVQELLSLPLLLISPISLLPVVHPRTFEVLGGHVLDVHGTGGGGAMVPHGLHVLVLREVLGEVLPVTSQNVHHATRKVRRVENLGGGKKEKEN